MIAVTWFALAAPGETPAPIVAKVASDVASVLKSPGVAQRLKAVSLMPVGNAPKDAAAFVADDARRWQRVIEMIGLQPE